MNYNETNEKKSENLKFKNEEIWNDEEIKSLRFLSLWSNTLKEETKC